MNIVSSSQANVKLPSDDDILNIFGCAFLPNGKILLADGANKKVKLLNSSFAVEDSLAFSCEACDITAVDDGTAIVVFPGVLQYIHITPKLKSGRTVSVDIDIYSVVVVNDDLFACCVKNDDKGEIIVLDNDGNAKRRIDAKKEFFGSRLFKWPRYITSNMSRTKIYVSDPDTNMVSCLTNDGTIIFQYKDRSMRALRGLYVDAEDNLLVCSWYDHNGVQAITADGKKYIKAVLSKQDGLDCPQGIDFRLSDKTLVVVCYGKENLLIYKLA